MYNWSLLFITCWSFVAGALFKSTLGFIVTVISQTIWISTWYLVNDLQLYNVSAMDILVYFMISIALWNIAGIVIANALNFNRMLTFSSIKTAERIEKLLKRKKGIPVSEEEGKSESQMFRSFMWLIFYLISFTPNELIIDDLPKPAGGFITLVLNIVMWIIFYFLFKDTLLSYKIKSEGVVKDSTIVRNVSLWLGGINAVYIIFYICFEAWYDPFYTDKVYFWISLFFVFATMIIGFIVGATYVKKKTRTNP